MPARSTRVDLTGATIVVLSVLVFCLVLLCHDPLVFWNDDYQLSVLPVLHDIARSWGEGHLPLLSPYSWVCSNLAGEFQYGTFSIFVNAAIVLIWKIFANFSQQAAALSIVHLFVLATGGFTLARSRNFSQPLSIMVALIASLNGWIICWGAPDWFGALGACAWLPWAWWGLERALDSQRSRWRFLWPVPFVYLVCTGGFPYTVLMLGVLVAWLSFRSLVQTRKISAIGPLLFGVALGFGLATPALFALLDYVHGSARATHSASAHWQWIVPPAALPGIILPSWTVHWADFSTHYVPHTGTELACGLVAPAALVTGLIGRWRALLHRLRWELFLLGVVLLIAMLPSGGVFRWSFRWLPFFHLVLAVCAAEALRDLGESELDGPRLRPGLVALFLVGVSTIVMLLLGAEGSFAFPLTWIFLILAAIWTLADLFVKNRSAHAWLPPALTFASLLATYLCIPPNCGVPRYNLVEELKNPSPLDTARLYLSIYTPAETAYRMETRAEPIGQIVRPGSTSMWAGLHFINGYSPILPAGVACEFAFSIHGEFNPNTARYLLSDQAGPNGQLADLGVDGVTIASEIDFDPQPAAEWEKVVSAAEGRVFHRRGQPFSRVRSVNSIASRPDERFVSARISDIRDSRNYVEADVEVPGGASPALITFSRPYFRGYKAILDSKTLSVNSDHGLFPIVEVPGGSKGHLTLSYRPDWLVYGGALSLLCAGIWVSGVVGAAISGRRRAVATDQ